MEHKHLEEMTINEVDGGMLNVVVVLCLSYAPTFIFLHDVGTWWALGCGACHVAC